MDTLWLHFENHVNILVCIVMQLLAIVPVYNCWYLHVVLQSSPINRNSIHLEFKGWVVNGFLCADWNEARNVIIVFSA